MRSRSDGYPIRMCVPPPEGYNEAKFFIAEYIENCRPLLRQLEGSKCMEKVVFVDPETKENIEFFVVEETQINGKKYLLVTEEEDGDSDAYILEELANDNDDIVYGMVEDDAELTALGKVFAELIDDADIKY